MIQCFTTKNIFVRNWAGFNNRIFIGMNELSNVSLEVLAIDREREHIQCTFLSQKAIFNKQTFFINMQMYMQLEKAMKKEVQKPQHGMRKCSDYA